MSSPPLDPIADDWNLFEEYRRFRQHPVHFLSDTHRMMSGADFAAYDNVTGAQLFRTSHWQRRMIVLTLDQPLMKSVVDNLVTNELQRENSVLELTKEQRAQRERTCRAQIRKLLEDISLKALPTFSRITAVRFQYLFISQVLSRAYRQGMHISKAQVARLQARAKECQAKKQSLVLFPSHKSHLDYVSLVYVFFRLGLSLPMTMAGDNLDIPLVSWFLRQVGATFIRRGNWKEDPLYNPFFQSLVNTILQQGVNLQIFIEGTRSRTGKLLPPKYGLLKFIYEAVASGTVDDCWILPISTQYDKVVEADTYATELMGREKRKENFFSFLDSRSIVKVNLGRIDIQISEGFSLKSFIGEQLAASTPAPQILRTLAYRILGDVNHVSVVMPSDLVGTALLTTRQRGLSTDDMVYRVGRLIRRVLQRGGRLGAVPKPAEELTNDDISLIVVKAIEVLGSELVTVETRRLLEPVYTAKDEFKLSYYRNHVVHLFVDEALICICLHQHYNQTLNLEIPLDVLEKKVAYLSRLLSGEFVFESNRELETAMHDALIRLRQQKVLSAISSSSVTISADEIRSDWVYTHFYCYLVWPFIDGYWSAVMSLQLLPLNTPLKIKEFLDMAQMVANTLYYEGALAHVEACNREIILSAINQAEARNVITRTRQTITLVADHATLAKIGADISVYRNEVQKRPADSDLLLRVQALAKDLVQSKL